ncbi:MULTISPECIES: DUF3611 family protein [unclassified Thiocapsa]|uniref:DUF3611 family protein n=1 Tax=unclassified Thiocapsa TaxID=2641286 RepID=UPI0035B0E5F4
MLNKLLASLHSPSAENLSRAFAKLGKAGFWLQLVLGSVPVVLMFYSFVFAASPSGPRAGLPIVEHLTVATLLVLIFTTFWFWRYTKVAQQIADPATRPPESKVVRMVWTGLVATSIGVFLSLVVMIIETSHLLFYFLSVPQGGVPVFQTTVQASWVSAVDMLSLLALALVLAAEVIALVFGLWLLLRTTQTYDQMKTQG